MKTKPSALVMAPGPWAVTPSGGIGFSGSAGFDLEPWGNNDPVPQEILQLIAAAPRLARSVMNLMAALEAHIFVAAGKAGVKPVDYCPCWSNELVEARQALQEAGLL